MYTREKECNHGGRDWSDMITSQGMQTERERGKEQIFP